MWGMMREVGRHIGRNIQDDLLDRVGRNNLFYTLGSLDGRIVDLDGRITDDISDVCGGFGMGSGSVGLGPLVYAGTQPLVRLTWFTFRLVGYVGWFWPAALAAYSVGSLAITRLLWKDLQWLSKEASRLDSVFKRIHARVRLHAESIAFYGGGGAERQFAERQFEEVLTHERKVQWMKFKLGWAQQIFDARIPEILKNWLRFFFSVNFVGSNEEILRDQGQSLNADQQVIATSMEVIFQNLGRLISLPSTFYNIAGKVQRIGELHEVLDEVIADQKETAPQEETASKEREDAEMRIAFEGVDIVSPGGDSFASAVSFDVQKTQGLMVTGRSAVGKTSLVRVLSGLWPTAAGTVVRPGAAAGRPSHLSEVFIVPQSIHMVLGSLADQVTVRQPLSFPSQHSSLRKLLHSTRSSCPRASGRRRWRRSCSRC